jgi:sialate O-acetylesterase
MRKGAFIPLLAVWLCNPDVRADVRLPAIFGDHMVLQQECPVPVWGWADAGEKVSVSFGNYRAETVTGPGGKWKAVLPAIPAGTPEGTLVVAGRNTVTLQDVLVGDVWLCSGQSNMGHGLREAQAGKIADTQIRIFEVGRKMGLVPIDDLAGSWKVFTVKSGTGFSAVGGFFASNLRPVLNQPIGLIEATWGGTPAQAWTPLSGLDRQPELAQYVEKFRSDSALFPGGQPELEAKLAANEAALRDRNEKLLADATYQEAVKVWREQMEEAKKANRPLPEKPREPIPLPAAVGIGSATPALLFNGMIHPLVPYAIKGVIWYQGEANATKSAAFEYRSLFPAMISEWRAMWNQGDFPFLFVQLPNFRSHPKTPDASSDWAVLRESQLKTLALPNTGMAVTIDVGDARDLHPGDKESVGRRLALVARHVAYAENLSWTGPIYDSMKVEGNSIRISFRPGSLGGGLTAGAAPGGQRPEAKDKIEGFVIAGEDQKWFWADAALDGESVIVSCPEVPRPAAVRYAWADNPVCSLYNLEGLPASPFRTDEWTLPADPEKK